MGRMLRAVQPDGQLLLSLAESEAARREEAEARRRLEEDLAQLRARLDHEQE